MTVELEATIRGNLLLSQLAVHERNAIHRSAEAISLTAGESLLRASTQSAYMFFPTTCVVSVTRTLRDGNSMEIALIGHEGIIGLDVFMGSRLQIDDAVVQSSGCAYRIPAEELRRQLQRGGGLQKSLLRFTYALFTQVAQNAVCVRFHAPEARLARWLMMINDRTSSLRLRVDARATAAVLVVAPAVISAAIDRLRVRGAISVRADAITITDREGLEIAACECYETIREEYERMLAP
jgi:CRP-like cAMP-binding protein